ncbi:MAG: hypothetical protein IK102_00075 [Treponema sp.]|nr:hypothetical protein [Treponema sp.]
MKNRIVAKVFLFLLICSPLSAVNQGVMSGAGKLRVSQTKWFDIIYAPKNAVTAKILYENADDIYSRLAQSYGVEPFLRMPVVITSTVEQFNAYQTNTPYACIVIYDTAVSSDLAVFSQTLLSTFTHELTHALTYNLKDDAYKVLAKIWGDGWAGYYLSITRGIAEGATVSYESSTGEGRLNDSYVLQMLRQAKIEGQFPSYSDVKGASDSYPANSFYYFNGAFAQFLQQNYGMDKYAEFWFRCVNLKNYTAAGAFKKAFGIKLNQAWTLFKDSFEVPEVAGANPVELGQAYDFFDPAANDYSINNNAGSTYTNLCASSKGIYYSGGSYNWVYFVDTAQLQKGGAVKPKRIFRHDYLDGLTVSADGRFAAVSYYSNLSSNTKHKAAIYDLQNKTWFNIPQSNIACPSIIIKDGQYYVVWQKYEPQKYFICVNKIRLEKNIRGLEETAVLEFGPEEIPFDFTDLGDGRLAFIKKSELNYGICVADLELSAVQEYMVPQEGIRLQNLSSVMGEGQTGRLAFSWATKQTLPRLGFFDTNLAQFSLYKKNISGGIHEPALSADSQIIYVAKFFRQNRLLKLNQNEQDYDTYIAQAQDTQPAAAPLITTQVLPYKPFKPFSYAFKGFLLPVSIASTDSNLTPLGFTYITSTPWTSGLFITSGGYGIQAGAGAFHMEYSGGTGTSLFTYDISSDMVIDGMGMSQVSANVSAQNRFDFGTRSAALFAASAKAVYGRSDFLVNYQSLSATYSNIVSYGPGKYERGGFTFSTGVIHSGSVKVKPVFAKDMDYFDLVFALETDIPRLIPVLCHNNFTYNLPLKLKAGLFASNAGNYSVASASAEALLFGYNIQKAIPGVSALFINDVILTLRYMGGFDFADIADYDVNWHIAYLDKYVRQIADGTIKYRDYATIKLTLGFTPNVGGFADTQFRYNFFLSYSFGKKENLPQKLFDLGLEAKF